jgi:gas vesicle protein
MTREHRNSADQRSRFVLGLACGAILGVSLGMLFAPRSGAQSRTWIAERGRTVARRVRISRQEATDIVRHKGVRGLFAVLRGGAHASTDRQEVI